MRALTSSRFLRPLVILWILTIVLFGLRPAAAANDPYANQQWNLTQIHAPSAWSVSTGGGVRIGIVDSGVNRNHEELSAQVADAVTCVGTNGDANACRAGGDDIDGHGTHVSGIAAAMNGNGKGIAGVAPTAQLVMARVFSPGANPGDDPTADLKDVEAGIRYVVKQGHAKVVNLSIGAQEQGGLQGCGALGNCQSPLNAAVEEAWTLGALPVIASGNSALYGSQGYGNLDAIVVGATGARDTVAAYSAPIGNAKWGMVAPGGDPVNSQDTANMVLSTYAGNTCNPPSNGSCYAYLAGTSMAAPHVSAVAAMLFARGLSRQAVVDTLLSSADPIAGCGASRCGAGRLNAAKALGANESTTPPGGGDAANPTTTKRPTSNAKAPLTTQVTAGSATSTSSFGFGNGTTNPATSTTSKLPRVAIVLNQQSDSNNGVPLGVGLAGVMCLAFAGLALSYSLRRTLTTLP